MKIRTVIINALLSRDKVNGNSYFSCEIIVNFGMKTEKTLYVPYQYGYGNAYYFACLEALNLDTKEASNLHIMENKVKVSRKLCKLLNSEGYYTFNRVLEETKF